jgi:BirA family transcriptional regulator, biotin operon repressor / biotin---[acetyl-CoA-carboxylase] ligase
MNDPDWLHWLATCPSTNTWAAAHGADLAHGAVVFTPCQTAGRGQWGRSWIAPTGGLTASFVLRSAIPIGQLGQISLLAGLAVIQALEQLAPELSSRLQIKWPNDIWLDGRKLAGILSEVTDGVVIVGIGLNRQADFAATALADGLRPTGGHRAISLHEVLPTLPSEMLLLETLRSQLLDLAGALPSPTGQLKVEWVRSINQRDLLRDRTITVQLGTETLVGVGLGIDWQGGYQLRLLDGTLKSLRSGQIVSWA